MTIRIYPSRLEGEPLETHETEKVVSVAEWFQSVAPSFDLSATGRHPTVRINGSEIYHEEWPLTYFGPSDSVDIYIEPRGEVAILVISAIISLASIVIALTQRAPHIQNQQSHNRNGDALSDGSATANRVRYGEPIPEIAGSPITFPDYILPPHRYYHERTSLRTIQLLCLGWGEYQVSPADVFIGDTPATSLTDEVEIIFYEPGETIPAPYSEWWHSPSEVGFTSFGGAGIALSAPTPGGGAGGDGSTEWTAPMSWSGNRITNTLQPVPTTWYLGMRLTVDYRHLIQFGGDWIESAMLDSLDAQIGESVRITGANEGVYTIASITPPSGGDPGSPALATGGAAPTRFDFGDEHASLSISLGGTPYSVSLTTTVANINELIIAINSQLNGTPVRARNSSGVVEIFQLTPYGGESITLSGAVSTLFGTPTYTAGSPTIEPSTKSRYHMTGALFPSGSVSAGVLIYRDEFWGAFRLTASNWSSWIEVEPDGMTGWTGWPAGNTDRGAVYEAKRDSGGPGESPVSSGWTGPYAAVPQGEVADKFEVDIFFPQGLVWYSDGSPRESVLGVTVEWRRQGSPIWNTENFQATASTPDQIGFTFGVDVNPPGRFEVRVQVSSVASSNPNYRHAAEWSGLRSRIVNSKTSYPGMTTMSVQFFSGNKMGASTENKISVRPTRVLPTVADPEVSAPTRDIAPYFIHMMDSVGYGREHIDMDQLTALHAIWTGRNDTFDLAVTSSSTLKTVANQCLMAGFAELTLRRGKITPVRDALRSGSPTRVYSPQEYVEPLIESTETILPDDIDGVDIEYIDYETGRSKTVSYRLPSDLGVRVETITAPGVTNETQAWRIAARHRRTLAYRRTSFKGSTELAAMNSNYLDYVGLQDGIPQYGQSAFVIFASGGTVDEPDVSIILSETVKEIDGDPIVMIRRPDGTATPPVAITAISGSRIVVEAVPEDAKLSANPDNPSVVYLGSTTEIMHKALITEIAPRGDGRVDFEAVIMDNRVYADDNSTPTTPAEFEDPSGFDPKVVNNPDTISRIVDVIEWPEILPTMLFGSTFSPVDPQSSIDLPGRAEAVSYFGGVPENFPARWILTGEQGVEFERFYREDLLDGVRWFRMPTLLPQGLKLRKVRFQGAFTRSQLRNGNTPVWEYTANMQLYLRESVETLTSRPYRLESYDTAHAIFNTNVSLRSPPTGLSAAGLEGMTFKAKLIKKVSYSDYHQPLSEATGLSSMTFKARLIKTVEYGEYTQPLSEAAGLDEITFKARLIKRVIGAEPHYDGVGGIFATEVTLVPV